MTLVDAGALMPPDHYLSMVRNFMDQLPLDPPIIKDGFPVLVSGSLIEDPGVLDIIESSGGRVVSDDLCNGFRQMFPPDGIGETPMDRAIDRYMNRFSCPARSRAVDRSRRLLGLARDSGARGVIFVEQKFCTPHLADHPAVSEALKQNGFPSILIEMDETWQMEAQLKTRLESFFENMGYSRDLCGYLRNIIGYVHGLMNEKDSPFGGLPEPDMILSPGGGCVPVMKIFHALERRFPESKVFYADLPQVAIEDIQDYHVEYAMSESQRLADFLTETTGRHPSPWARWKSRRLWKRNSASRR